MKTFEHLLISLEERHAENILAGVKTVELRRRVMHVAVGDRVWLYAKKPIGAVVGYVTVAGTLNVAPQKLWRICGSVSGLTKEEFQSYFSDVDEAFALELSAPKYLKRTITLEELRLAQTNFHPPQFYCKISKDSTLFDLLSRATLKRLMDPV